MASDDKNSKDVQDTTDVSDKYIFFDKTADAKYQAFGVTLEECFKHALEAMMSLMYPLDAIGDVDFAIEHREIRVEGDNLEALLYNFLEESIFLLAAEFFVGLVTKIIIHEEDGKYILKAKLEGTQSINIESIGPEIKAVTYNEMYVKYDKKKEQYECQVVVDI